MFFRNPFEESQFFGISQSPWPGKRFGGESDEQVDAVFPTESGQRGGGFGLDLTMSQRRCLAEIINSRFVISTGERIAKRDD